MHIKIECGQCNGDGYVPLEEDGEIVQHACYACGTDGYHIYNDDQYCDFVNEMIDEVLAEEKAA